MMSAYYNEIDPYAAQWLRNLIAAGHISPGEVDSRSIVDVRPADLRGFERVHFFAGIAVWDYALGLAQWPAGREIWTGSCPCQPFSAAGKRGGTADERHLWPEFFRLIKECGPATVVGEQVASKDGLDWLDAVQADLEGAGYAVGAADLCAAGVGAPHIRQRLWFVAHADGRERHGLANGEGRLANRTQAGRLESDCELERGGFSCVLGDVGGAGLPACECEELCGTGRREEGRATLQPSRSFWSDADWLPCRDGKARPVESGSFPLAHGSAGRMVVRRSRLESGSEVQEEHWYSRAGALRGFGNAINAEAAAAFLSACLEVLP